MTDHLMIPLQITERQTTYSCPFMEIYHRRAQFDGFAKDYYVVSFKRRGGIVAVQNGNVLLVRQYRFLINGHSWELPGGTIEDAENMEHGLIRECFEETGVRPRRLQPLVVYYPGLDNVDNRTTVFYSENVEIAGPFKGNPAEVSQIAWIPFDTCLQMVFSQQILDAMTVAGLLAYDHVSRQRNISGRRA